MLHSFGINGFGRIGRTIFRITWNSEYPIKCKIINDPNMSIDNLIYLLKFDSIYGKLNALITKMDDNRICVKNNNKEWIIHITNNVNIEEIDWHKLTTCIIEASGKISIKQLRKINGIKHILVTNWNDEADFTIIYGYNDKDIDLNKYHIISTGICDTAAIVPVLNVFYKKMKIEYCSIVTLHPWLNYQNLLDAPIDSNLTYLDNKVFYQIGRESVNNLIPKPSILEKLLCKLFPEIKNNLIVMAYRVPTDRVSVADLTIKVNIDLSEDDLSDILKEIEDSVIGKSSELMVSSDYVGMNTAGVLDFNWSVIKNKLIHLVVWYDNEWGYSTRIVSALLELLKVK